MAEVKIITKSRTRNLYGLQYAKVTADTEDTYTAGDKIDLKGAIKAKLSDKYESEMVYSDGTVEEVLGEFTEGDIELEISRLIPQEREALLNQLYKEGFLIKSEDDNPGKVAISFISEMKDGKQEFTQLYCVTFNQGDEVEYNTKEDKIQTKTNTLKGKYYARKKPIVIDGESRNPYAVVLDEEQMEATYTNAADAITAWRTKVVEPKFGATV
ncbi:major tail protein [Eubacterium barkeri]|uniref:Phage major tail protein, phi13 family n=1 Tax=Eubacterium barkeri TaxID=1528 RepID=A0A1H3BJM5_EUBBA|nr:major tail protein [Eubacterium barkeri]SDX42097.1 phage major tail protein, phi13 family [Eubacterium barkeri]